MKLTQKQKKIIVLAIAALFFLYGFLDMQFKFNIKKSVVDSVSMILFILAFGLLFSGRNNKQTSSENDITKSEQESAEQNDKNKSLQESTDEKDTNKTI